MTKKTILFCICSAIGLLFACSENPTLTPVVVSDKITMNVNGKDWTADSTSLSLSVDQKFYVLRGEKYVSNGTKKVLGDLILFNLPKTIKTGDVITLPDYGSRDLDITIANYISNDFFVLSYDSRGKGQIFITKFDGKKLDAAFSGSIYYANDVKEVKTGVISVTVKK